MSTRGKFQALLDDAIKVQGGRAGITGGVDGKYFHRLASRAPYC